MTGTDDISIDMTTRQDGWIEAPAVVVEAVYDAALTPRTTLFVAVGRDTKLSFSLRGRDALQIYETRSIEALRAFVAKGSAE